MKKVFYVIGLAAIMGFACSSETKEANKNEASTNETTQVEAEAIETAEPVAETTAVSSEMSGLVNKMTTQEFVDQIFDFRSNTETWEYKGTRPVIIDFYADWCGPCKRIAPIMDELAAEYGDDLDIYKIDTDKEQELASAFGIRSIPSILFIPKEGQPKMYTGAFAKAKYIELIAQDLQITK